MPRWKRLLGSRSSIIAVAEVNNDIIGFAVLRWWFGWNGWLEEIAVREEFRGRGVGRALMEYLIKHAEEIGYRRICLATQSEKAERFYSKFNAVLIGEIPDEEVGKLKLYYITI